MDSLVDLRVSDDVDGKRALGENEILDLAAEFLATNRKVVVACIEWTLANLVIQPEVQKKLRHEIDKAEGLLSAEKEKGMPYLRAVVLERDRKSVV